MKETFQPRGSFALCFALLFLAAGAFAQAPTGNLYGTVVDGQGGALPGVSINVTGIGAPRSQTTNARGEFRFLSLDPGAYQVKAELEGMSAVDYPNVQVSLNQNTSIAITLSPAVEETITVTSESPLLDERKLIAGTQLNQTELEKIPSARDPWSLLSQTPGVLVDRINVGGNESGQQSIFRAQAVSDNENDFLVDGVQITDMRATGASSTYYDFDQFSQMQFTTGGTDVTKNTSGVSVNLVTKRGSNEFRGSARFFNVKASGVFGGVLEQAQPNVQSELEPGQCLPGDTRSTCTETYQGAQIREIEEVGFEAGGAVLQNKLWAWGSWGQNTIQQNAATGTADDTILENTSVKLNAQFAQSNSAVGSWNNGDKQKFGRGAGFSRPDETTWNQRGPSAIARFEDTHVFSSNFFFTGTYSVGDFGFQLAAKAGTGPNAPESWQDINGVWHDNYLSGFTSGPNDEWKIDGSYFFNTGATGHELKVGGRFRTYESFSAFTWPGRDVFTDNTVAGLTQPVAHRGVTTPVVMEYASVWAQDTISLGKATINVGVRYDDQSGVNSAYKVPANPAVPLVLPALDYAGGGKEFSYQDLTPRLGFTYALGSKRDTLLRASFSQFADQLGTGTVSRTNPAGNAYAYFTAAPIAGPFQNFESLNNPALVAFGVGFDPANPTALVDPDVTDPNLSAPLTDELLAGVEHALLPQFVVGLNFTYRKVTDIQENRTILRNADGTTRTRTAADFTSAGFVTGTIPASVTGGSPRTFTREVFAENPGLVRTGGTLLLNGSREREYVGGAVTFTKRLSNRWMMRGFVNVGSAEWKVPDDFLRNDDPNLIPQGGDSNGDLYITQSAGSGKGIRYLESGWTANINGMYQVAPDRPWGFNVSGNIQAREGHPLPFFQTLRLSGRNYTVGAVENLDDYRLDDVVTTDLRVEKEFNLAGPINLTFGLDAFNITNEGTALARERNLGSSRAFYVLDNVSPRIYRLSARLAWK